MLYEKMSKSELSAEKEKLLGIYEDYRKMNLSLDMSRGKPNSDQLDLTVGLLDALTGKDCCRSSDGMDCRNYGGLVGIPEIRALFSEILSVPEKNVIIGGSSSLTLMYDAISRAMLFGVPGSPEPWCRRSKVKFLCPVPGYDRHFAICEHFGIEMINIPMTETGPDMDAVERLVSQDADIKGIWCVPKYSNPTGIIYSDETVRRFARLRPAAPDFRIMWDNAYAVHGLDGIGEPLLSLYDEAVKCGNENIFYIFTSTAKVSFPGAGVSAVAASDENIEHIKKSMSYQMISHDKLNQLRHIRYFKNMDGISEQMKKYASVIKPKFDIVTDALEKELAPLGIASFTKPRGGYFISLDLADGTAKRTWELAHALGVTLTSAGATFPYKKDPRDRNLRIAPTYPPNDELRIAVSVLCLCARLAWLEKA